MMPLSEERRIRIMLSSETDDGLIQRAKVTTNRSLKILINKMLEERAKALFKIHLRRQ